MRYKLSFDLNFKDKEKLRKLLDKNNISYGVNSNPRKVDEKTTEFVNFFNLTKKAYLEELEKGFEELF